ncbi:hypothetical protein C2845_PM16G12980 [Panicum miliaceum]|uniref:Uncharacterized protein n=1 Tax=Panicum miliaceum TaxID=4540 RepID=A0A3L6PY39_PANMI|nr:hypothetical protein C2845_PM16G12980 [Panicum miliaceum]
MKPGAAPPSVKPTLLRAEDQDYALKIRNGSPPSWSFTGHHQAPARPCSVVGGGRRRGYARYLPNQGETGDIRVDLSRTNAIQRLWETQRVDGISFTVAPVGIRHTVHPLAPLAPSAGRRPRRQAAPSSCALTSAGRSCCCGWTTPKALHVASA